MKKLTFQQHATVELYQRYIARVRRVTKTLPRIDREDILMEINSHIHERMQNIGNHGAEDETLRHILDKLGDPAVVFEPLVAGRRVKQASFSHRPNILRVLARHVSSGVTYLLFSLLCLLQLVLVFVIGAKLIYPDEVGLFFKDGGFELLGIAALDVRQQNGLEEVLGNWFIPTMLAIAILFYSLSTLLLRLAQKWRAFF